MPHILAGDDLSGEINRFVSAFATVEANQAASVYPADQMPHIDAAKAEILRIDDALCEKLKAARLKFQEKCHIAEPE